MEIREAKDLLNLKWRNLTSEELKELPCTVNGELICHRYCTEKHVEAFIKKIVENVSREFEIPVEDVENIITQENEIFFMMKEELFCKWNSTTLPYNGFKIENLLSYFKVPEMPSVDKVLREYKRLSSKQKQEFKARI